MTTEQFISYLESFHFLNEKWLWFYVPWLVLLLFYFLAKKRENNWINLIAPKFRKVVIINYKKRSISLPGVTMFLLLSMVIFGAAGPTYKLKEYPKIENESYAWIALDLSQSMMAKDITPNRLERAKLKVRDLFKEEPNTKLGLMAFAGTPHIVFPPSYDKEVMVPYMTTLKPRIMPVKGSNFKLLSEFSDSLLTHPKAPPTFILITDEMNREEASEILKLQKRTNCHVNIWVASSTHGGPVPNPRNSKRNLFFEGDEVQSSFSPSVASLLAKSKGINVLPLSLDNSDVTFLKDQLQQHLKVKTADSKKDKDWDDIGIYFLYPSLLLMLLWFRRGWAINWCVVVLLSQGCGTDSQHPEWWYSPDYLGDLYMKDTAFKKAANTYQDPSKKAYALYKAGEIDEAIITYATDTSISSIYNQGVLYTEIGKIDMAKAMFSLAAQKDSTFTPAITALDSIRILYPKDTSNLIATWNPKKEQVSFELNELKEDEKKYTDEKYDKNKENNETQPDKVFSDKRKAKEMEWPDSLKDKKDVTQQFDPSKLIIEKANNDPSEFLRKKFLFQKNKLYPTIKQPKKQW